MAKNYQINQKRDFNPFNRVEVDVPQRNTFDLSHDNKLTLDMGKLVPVTIHTVHRVLMDPINLLLPAKTTARLVNL